MASAFSLGAEVVQLKRAPKEHLDYQWMNRTSSKIPTQAFRDLDKAYAAWFKRMSQGLQGGKPQFKSKDLENGHFTIAAERGISVSEKRIKIPSVGSVCIVPGQRDYIPDGDYKTYQRVTVSQVKNHWYATLHVEVPVAPCKPVSAETMVGIDVGVRELCHLSDGTVIPTPTISAKLLKKQHRLELKISRKQRAASKKFGTPEKGEKRKESNRLKKERLKLQKVTQAISNTRTDYCHKVTTAIAKKYSIVVMEDLKGQNMTKAAKPNAETGFRVGRAAKAALNRSILDSCMLRMKGLFSYKMPLYGGKQFLMPAAYTSQKCSASGCDAYNNVGSSKIYTCAKCGLIIDRDLNASLNLVAAVGKPEATMNLESGTMLPGLARPPVCVTKVTRTGGKCRTKALVSRKRNRKAVKPKNGICGIENALGSCLALSGNEDPCNQTGEILV